MKEEISRIIILWCTLVSIGVAFGFLLIFKQYPVFFAGFISGLFTLMSARGVYILISETEWYKSKIKEKSCS